MSRNKSASKISLASFDELFQPTQPGADLAERDRVVELPISVLRDFDNHPYLVQDDERMEELTESIRDQGILSPLVVRSLTDGTYEVISGHRRKRGAQLAGLETVPVIIRVLTDDEAVIAMVNANLQREVLYPSEKAKAYKMKYDAMKHQGQNGGRTLKALGEESGESQMSIHRYLRLNELVPELLQMVDAGKLGFSQAVDLSYLTAEAQGWVLERIRDSNLHVSMKHSSRLKECAKNNELSAVMTAWILEDQNRMGRKKQFTLKGDKIRSYFSADASDEEIEGTILKLLEKWKEEADEE